MNDQSVIGLHGLFPGHDLFADTDGDGYPDWIGLRIQASRRLTDPAVWAGMINLCARLAAQVTALRLPLVVGSQEQADQGCRLCIGSPKSSGGPAAVMRRADDATLWLTGCSGTAMARILNELAMAGPEASMPAGWRKVVLAVPEAPCQVLGRGGKLLAEGGARAVSGLGQAGDGAGSGGPLDLIDAEGLLCETVPEAPRASALKLKIQIDATALDGTVGRSLAHLAARACLQSTDIHLPVAGVAPPTGKGLRLRVAGGDPEPGIPCLHAEGDEIVARGGGRRLAATLESWQRLVLPVLGQESGETAQLAAKFERVRGLLNASGPEGVIAWRLVAAANGRCPVPNLDGAERRQMRRAVQDLGLALPPSPPRRILRRISSWPGEDERLTALIGSVPAGEGPCHGTVLVSRPLEIRNALRDRWEKMLRQKGYRPCLTLINAYKPGFSWLMDVALPSLVAQGGADRLELAFCPFVPEPGGLEMESRWIQEAFPGPDLVAERLGMDPAAVALVQQKDLPHAYRLRAWQQDRLVAEAVFTPRISPVPYLPLVLEGQWAYPAAAGVRLEDSRGVLLDVNLPTDREVFWRRFQEEWLPVLSREMDLRRDALAADGAPAFWQELCLELTLPESDVRLGVGKERICPLEAVHEDIYFGLLEFHAAYRRKHGLGDDLNFGPILPKMHCRQGALPKAHLVARAMPIHGGGTIPPPAQPATVRGLERRGRNLDLFWHAPGITSEQSASLAVVARAGGLRLVPISRGFRLTVPLAGSKPVFGDDGAVPEPPDHRRLDLVETEAWIRRLGTLPHLHAWTGGTSLGGRPIHVLEASLDAQGLKSRGKLRFFKPTLLFNARHHANEVSSTNAALRLAWRLSRTEAGRDLLKRVNVAFIPLENPDGVATLEALSPGCADHKLHAARYNALGVEWYGDYHRERPRFPEARVKPLVWQRWMPRFMLDAHGVPSHEWDQPFAGLVNPSFREHWIPRTFVFAILPFLDQPAHPGHAIVMALVDRLAEAMAADPQIVNLNNGLTDRYDRYARAFAPQVFPASVSDALVVVPAAPRISDINFARVHWPLTEVEMITEVADEVVEGSWLACCVRAHMAAAMALLNQLAQQPLAVLKGIYDRKGGMTLSWRHRGQA